MLSELGVSLKKRFCRIEFRDKLWFGKVEKRNNECDQEMRFIII